MSYSKTQINNAGKIFKDMLAQDINDIKWAEDALTYWRTIHSSILDDFHIDLKAKVDEVNKGSLIVQRLKRSQSIIFKLNRIDGMKLSRMQDIAGVRVVVESISEVYSLAKKLQASDFKHEFKNIKDYIQEPKESGYRGIHLIYKYSSPENPEINGLYIEVQLRTKLQHTWATAVETLSTFLGTHLKFDQGQPKWLKYFALTSSAFSFIEKTPAVPKYNKLTEYETLQMAVYEYNYNHISESLSGYTVAADFICKKVDPNKKYHIVTLNSELREAHVESFRADEIHIANKKYTEIERNSDSDSPKQSVLVSTDSIKELQNGFPNYFLDIREFLIQMDSIKMRLINERK